MTYEFLAQRFCEDMAEARAKMGMSYRKAAQHIGVSHATVHDIEKRANNPRVTTFLRICNALGLSPSRYFAGATNHLEPGAYTLDKNKLQAVAKEKRSRTHFCQVRAYMADSGVSHLSEWRARTGKHTPEITTFSLLCEWLEMPPSEFFEVTL